MTLLPMDADDKLLVSAMRDQKPGTRFKFIKGDPQTSPTKLQFVVMAEEKNFGERFWISATSDNDKHELSLLRSRCTSDNGRFLVLVGPIECSSENAVEVALS